MAVTAAVARPPARINAALFLIRRYSSSARH
jgi:hypothetical protein